MNLGGLSGVRAKLEPASSKDNEILEINVLQKFTSHPLSFKITSFHCFWFILHKFAELDLRDYFKDSGS